jgi:hypothetical protein
VKRRIEQLPPSDPTSILLDDIEGTPGPIEGFQRA